MSTNNYSSSSLEDWIREQYYVIGFDGNGQFIGKKAFKNRLTQVGVTNKPAGASKARIRQLVNK